MVYPGRIASSEDEPGKNPPCSNSFVIRRLPELQVIGRTAVDEVVELPNELI